MRKRTTPVRITGLRGAARSLVAAELIRTQGTRPVLLLTAHSRAADALAEDLRIALGEQEGETRVFAFPRHDTLPYERFSPQPFVTTQRMAILYQLLSSFDLASVAPIVVAPCVRSVAHHGVDLAQRCARHLLRCRPRRELHEVDLVDGRRDPPLEGCGNHAWACEGGGVVGRVSLNEMRAWNLYGQRLQ